MLCLVCVLYVTAGPRRFLFRQTIGRLRSEEVTTNALALALYPGCMTLNTNLLHEWFYT